MDTWNIHSYYHSVGCKQCMDISYVNNFLSKDIWNGLIIIMVLGELCTWPFHMFIIVCLKPMAKPVIIPLGDPPTGGAWPFHVSKN
jgi:hypothetical protein